EVLTNPNITKINFTTGPQGITGSTRMQATSSQTFLIVKLIQIGLVESLRIKFTDEEIKQKFDFNTYDTIEEAVINELKQFEEIHNDAIKSKDIIHTIADAEYECIKNNGTALYFGDELFTTLFIDITERAPTFSVDALDTVNPPYTSWA